MAFKKGNKEGKGRIKGSENNHTKQFKDLLSETYLALEDNSDKKEDEEQTGLLSWAKSNPTDFYRICAKLVPQQITGEGGGPIEVVQTYKLPDGTIIEFKS